MDVTGKGTSWQKLTSVSEEYRQKMFDNVKKEFIQENGISNGDTTKRSDIFKDYQLSVSKDKRLSGTWTLEQYEGQYRSAMYAAVKAANPNWKPGQKFDTSILDNVTKESVEATLVKNGNRLVRNSIDVSVQNTTSLVLEIRSNKLLHHGKSIKLGALDNITREKFSKTSGNSLNTYHINRYDNYKLCLYLLITGLYRKNCKFIFYVNFHFCRAGIRPALISL